MQPASAGLFRCLAGCHIPLTHSGLDLMPEYSDFLILVLNYSAKMYNNSFAVQYAFLSY